MMIGRGSDGHTNLDTPGDTGGRDWSVSMRTEAVVQSMTESTEAFIQDITDVWPFLTDEEKAYAQDLITGLQEWSPLAGPQSAAVYCTADELFYGGAAGGGKTDLIIGLGLTRHRVSIIYRREATQLVGILNRMAQVLGGRSEYSGQDKIWRHGERIIEFGSVKDPDDVEKYQGRPHDLKAFDEITHFLEGQYTYLNGWKRTERLDQDVRTVCTGNPPHRPEGLWVKKYWGPWLDRQNRLYNKVEPGELAYFYIDTEGKRQFKLDAEPVEVKGKQVVPRSITFIPSKVEDNPYYMATGYDQQLDSLPEPLRSQLRSGDFDAMSDDDPYQVIPTKWIKAAMGRWEPREVKKGELSEMGCDPARGGRDSTVLCRRYDVWFDELTEYPGGQTPNGQTVVSLIVGERTHDAPIVVDVIGIGASVVDIGELQGLHIIRWNSGTKAPGMHNNLRMKNRRSWGYWGFREALNPANDLGICLPNDDDLLAELSAHRFQARTDGIYVLSKDEVKAEIGRSPDKADAVIMSWLHTPKRRKTDRENLGIPTGKSDTSQPESWNPYD